MTPSQRARFFYSLHLVDARILAESEECKIRKSKKRNHESVAKAPFEIQECKDTIKSCPRKNDAVSDTFSADSKHEAHYSVNEFVQGQALSLQPVPGKKSFEVVQCSNAKITENLQEVNRDENEALVTSSHNGDNGNYVGSFSVYETSPRHHDHAVASLHGVKSTHIDDGGFRINLNRETKYQDSTLGLNKTGFIKRYGHANCIQEETKTCLPIRDHGSVEETRTLLFEPGKDFFDSDGVKQTGVEEVVRRNFHSDAMLHAEEMVKSVSDNSEPVGMRLLHVDSAAGLSDSSGFSSSPLWIKGAASGAMGTEPLLDGLLSVCCTTDSFGTQTAAEKLLHLHNNCMEAPKVNGCIHPCKDLDSVSTYSLEKEHTDLDDLSMLCAALSLDTELLMKSSLPDEHSRQNRLIPHASAGKDFKESRFFTKVAQIQAQNSISEREAIDAWMHHFVALQTEPYRLGVLLIAKASIGRSLANGAKTDNLVFPSVCKEYLKHKPSP